MQASPRAGFPTVGGLLLLAGLLLTGSTPACSPGAADAPPESGSGAGRVIVYSTSSCGWCRRTFAWLDSRGVPYENRDIQADPQHQRRLFALTGTRAIPVVVIGERLVRGFDPRRMRELLAGPVSEE